MTANNTTTRIILDAIADPSNRSQWRAFDDRYRPVIEGFARRLGLSEHEAADVAQETLVRFIKDFRSGKYDATRGRLRSWLISISKYRICDVKFENARRGGWRGESVIETLGTDEHISQCWEQEQRSAILKEAFRRLAADTHMAEATVKAFTMVTVEQKSAQAAASELGMTVEAVYVAKHRCLAALRNLLKDVEALYEGG